MSTPRRAVPEFMPKLAGYGMSADAHHWHPTWMAAASWSMPEERRHYAVRCAVRQCARHLDAARRQERIRCHQQAAFGDAAYKIVVNSTKSMTVTCWAVPAVSSRCSRCWPFHHQISPPTINIFNQDPECDLDYCANKVRPMKIDIRAEEQLVLAAPTARWSSSARLPVSCVEINGAVPDRYRTAPFSHSGCWFIASC